MSSNQKVDSIVTYVDLVPVNIMYIMIKSTLPALANLVQKVKYMAREWNWRGPGDKANFPQIVHSNVTHAFVFPLRITSHFKVDDLPCIVRFQHNPHSRQGKVAPSVGGRGMQ